MRIRKGNRGDGPALSNVATVGRADQGYRRTLIAAIREGTLYVGEVKGCLVCFAIVRRSFFGRPFLEVLHVKASERRRGYGEMLLIYIESRILKKTDLWASTNQSNRPMRYMLRERKFIPAGRVVGLDQGDPEVFYVKKRVPNQSKDPAA